MSTEKNKLYYGDNLEVLQRYVKDESIDLVYLDPPFNSRQDYNVLFAEKDGSQSSSQIHAFEDTWEWNIESKRALELVIEQGGRVADALRAFEAYLHGSDMMAYLAMMAPRLVELRRVLKETGSIYLHCDPTASHYLKILMDAVFGPSNFRNEIVWRYKKYQKAEMRYFTRNSDRILFYAKGANADAVFQPQFIHLDTPKKFLKRAWDKKTGRIVNAKDDEGHVQYIEITEEKIDDVWVLTYLMPAARERLGYPTQKPEALLERIIQASSNEGDLVLDPFCGCGTTVQVAQRLSRRWIGIDITHLAIGLIKKRLSDAFGPEIKSTYDVIGEPTDYAGAAQLAAENKFQFQAWALGLCDARVAESSKKGADRGIDGRLYFHDDESGKSKQIIFSVKGGGVSVPQVRDLRGVIEREKAEIGVFISFDEPTKPMLREAAEAGLYKSTDGTTYPRLQILTIQQLLSGKQPEYPLHRRDATFKKAPRSRPAAAENLSLPLLPLE